MLRLWIASTLARRSVYNRLVLRLWIASTLPLLGCKAVPTSVLLEIQAAPGVALDEIRLRVFEPAGEVVSDRRLPEQGKASVPASVVLYPRSSEGTLRLLARARLGGVATGEDATTVTPVRGAQVRASLLLRPGALADADHDGVPDLIDSCPTVANPTQGPCGGPDAGEAGRDLSDARADAPSDAPPIEARPPDQRPWDSLPPDLEKTDLKKTDLKKTDLKKTDLPKPDLPKPDLPKPDLPKPDLPKPDLPKPDLLKPDLLKPDTGCAPLAGSYTLGAGFGASFSSFAAAIAKLAKCGVSSATTITVAGGTYQEPGFSFVPIPGSSASARVTFRASPGATVKLVGVTSASGYAGIIRIATSTAHLVLEGFDLDGALTANVIPSSYSGPVLFENGGGQQDITLRRLEIHDFGPAAWTSHTYIGGIYIQQSVTVSDLTIEGCSFRNLSPPTSFHTQGAISTCNGSFTNLRIVGNRFSGVQKMDCLNLRNGSFEGLLVANNFFALDAGATAGALELCSSATLVGSGNRIVFNTVHAASKVPYALAGSVVAPGALQLQNNILQGAENIIATSFSTISGATIQGGHNCLYLASAGSYTTTATDLTSNPQLLSSLDLHLSSSSPLLGKGTSISGVTTDIDGQPRGSPPEIGADELP